jgi:hypothetical protein
MPETTRIADTTRATRRDSGGGRPPPPLLAATLGSSLPGVALLPAHWPSRRWGGVDGVPGDRLLGVHGAVVSLPPSGVHLRPGMDRSRSLQGRSDASPVERRCAPCIGALCGVTRIGSASLSGGACLPFAWKPPRWGELRVASRRRGHPGRRLVRRCLRQWRMAHRFVGFFLGRVLAPPSKSGRGRCSHMKRTPALWRGAGGAAGLWAVSGGRRRCLRERFLGFRLAH